MGKVGRALFVLADLGRMAVAREDFDFAGNGQTGFLAAQKKHTVKELIFLKRVHQNIIFFQQIQEITLMDI